MDRIKIVTHKDKNIIYLDFSSADMFNNKAEVLKLIQEAKEYIGKQSPNSQLTLTDATDLRFNMELIDILKGFTHHNKPFVKAGAIVGVKGLQKVAYDTVMKFTKRNIPIFSTAEEAMDWLAEQ